MHILFLIQTLFSIWMLVDAIRRGAEQFWWLIVMIPFGEVAYFIAVVLPDIQRGNHALSKLFTGRPPSLKELRRDFGQTPSHQNRVRLAQGLHDAELYEEGLSVFADVLGTEPEDRAALHGYARCCAETADIEQAIDALTHLFDIDMMYLEYEPGFMLARLLRQSGDSDAAIEVLEALSDSVHRLAPHVELGSYLIEAGRAVDAKRVLKSALDVYDGSPRTIRRQDGSAARRARRLLRAV